MNVMAFGGGFVRSGNRLAGERKFGKDQESLPRHDQTNFQAQNPYYDAIVFPRKFAGKISLFRARMAGYLAENLQAFPEPNE